MEWNVDGRPGGGFVQVEDRLDARDRHSQHETITQWALRHFPRNEQSFERKECAKMKKRMKKYYAVSILSEHAKTFNERDAGHVGDDAIQFFDVISRGKSERNHRVKGDEALQHDRDHENGKGKEIRHSRHKAIQ